MRPCVLCGQEHYAVFAFNENKDGTCQWVC